jgi:O-antigen ligase
VISVISICAAVGLMHAIDVNAFFDDTFRLHGTSNVVITYANMCATLLMICMYYIFYKNNKSYLLIISAFIFLTLLLLTETRGPFIGIIIISIYLVFILKNGTENRFNFMTPLILIFIFIVSIISIPNPLGERFKEMTKINLAEPLDTGNYYLRNRAYFIIYGIEELQTNYFKGVGPQNIRDRMSQSLKTKNVDKIIPTDHLHNDFLDITVKFGITSLILLFLIYFCIIKTKNKEHRILLNILMIMLLSSQLTQSQFAHHQAITFFITLFYLLREKSNSLR